MQPADGITVRQKSRALFQRYRPHPDILANLFPEQRLPAAYLICKSCRALDCAPATVFGRRSLSIILRVIVAMTDKPAEVHIVVVHAIPGFTALPAATVSLLSDNNASVWLTCEPEELCLHVDRKNALVKLLFTDGLGDAFEERFASAIAEARSGRKQRAQSHAWLVTDAFLLARLGHGTSRELPEFAVSIDSVSEETREDLERLADLALGRVTAGLSIILGDSKFPYIKRVAAANYSLRPGSPRLTYELRLDIGCPTLFISSPADEELIAALTGCIGQLPVLGVETALRLHKDALEESDDYLRSFIAAWASLEIFANKMFEANFNLSILSSLGLGGSGREGDLYARLTQIDAQEKLGIENWFAFLAVWLSRSSAKADIDLFARLNEARNDLYHRGVVARHLPRQDAINLFRKYLALAREALASEVMRLRHPR